MRFDWNQVRAFLATVEEGSLSAAARALGQTQPTLSRQIAALEQDLGVMLFQRVGKALVLAPAGIDLLDHVRSMGEAANRISLAASGQSQTIEGRVAITASDVLTAYVLPAVTRELQRVAPGIEIDLMSSNTVSDLSRREADIAIRHVRPAQPDLIGRLIGEGGARLFASSDYLDRHGRPASLADLSSHTFVGFEPVDRLVETMAAIGIPVTAGSFRYASNNGIAMGELVRQGLGIGMMPADFAAFVPGLEAILPDQAPALPVPFWLVTHGELHTSRRIRLVFDFLADTLFPLTRWSRTT